MTHVARARAYPDRHRAIRLFHFIVHGRNRVGGRATIRRNGDRLVYSLVTGCHEIPAVGVLLLDPEPDHKSSVPWSVRTGYGKGGTLPLGDRAGSGLYADDRVTVIVFYQNHRFTGVVVDRVQGERLDGNLYLTLVLILAVIRGLYRIINM